MQWHPAKHFPIDLDLRPFLSYLQQQEVLFKVNENKGMGNQQLMLRDKALCEPIAVKAQLWLAGELDIPQKALNIRRLKLAWPTADSCVKLAQSIPLTLLTLLLGSLGTLLVWLDYAQLRFVSIFLFQPYEYGYMIPAAEALGAGQYWRLITPAFIHFGILHLIFNAILILVLGARVELAKGSLHLLLVFLIIATLSNLTQYLSQADTIFGGLSGVAYGYVGYVATYQMRIKHPVLYFYPSILAIMVIWMFLEFFGITDIIVQARVANAAHLGGLVSGASLGLLSASFDKYSN